MHSQTVPNCSCVTSVVWLLIATFKWKQREKLYSICVAIHIYMCVYIYYCVCIYIIVCIYVYILYVYMCIYYICVAIHIYVYILLYILYMYSYAYTIYIYTHTNTHTHTWVSICIHTQFTECFFLVSYCSAEGGKSRPNSRLCGQDWLTVYLVSIVFYIIYRIIE